MPLVCSHKIGANTLRLDENPALIITCEKCQTRFKVGDDKFAGGAIRVRCSKCNHVFLAQGPGAAGPGLGAPPGATSAPPAFGGPPAFGAAPGFGAPVGGASFGAPFTPPLGPPPATTAPPPVGTPGPITGIFSMPANALPQPQLQAAGIFKPPPPQETLRINHTPPPAPPSLSPSSSSMPSSMPPSPFSSSSPTSQPPFSSSSSLPPTSSNAFGQNPLLQPPSTSLPPTQVVGKAGAPADDPFRGLDQFGRRPTPRPQTPPPQSVDPFAPKPTPRPAIPDPFATVPTVPLGANGQPPRIGAPDPFGLGGPPRAPTPGSPFGGAKDPFAGLGPPQPSSPPAPAPDPFGQLKPPATTPVPRAQTRDPFAGLAPSSPPPDPFAQMTSPSAASSPQSAGAFPDPFASTEPFNPQALMTTAPSQPPSTASNALPDPFGLSSPSPPIPADGALAADASETGAWTPSSSPPSPVGGSSPPVPVDDPFAGLDSELGGASDGQSLFETAQPPPAPEESSPSLAAPGASSAPGMSGASGARPAQSAQQFQAPPPTTGADMRKVRRAETTQRVREIVWAAAQLVLLAAFVVVAVVLARGGRVEDLVRGDVRAAFFGQRVKDGLAVDDVRVARRTLPSGIDVVVVTGVVVNTGAAVPAARVDVRFGDASGAPGPWTSGWAWSSVDGVDVDAIKDAPDAAPLSLRPPKSAAVQPGDRAPFVVVAPAPVEGAKAQISVTAAKP